MPSSRYPNARIHLVHLRGAKSADHFLIAADQPSFREGTRVHVQLPDGTWHAGVVDSRSTIEPGRPIMVTLENIPAH